MSTELPAYPNIPLAMFEDFFCLQWLQTNNRIPSLEVLPNTPPHFAKMLFDFFKLQHFTAELDLATKNSSVAGNLVTEIDGGVAACVRYSVNGVSRVVIYTARLEILPADESGEAYYGFNPETFFVGTEKKIGQESCIEPEYLICPVVEEDETYFDSPTNTNEFYTALNYMRFAFLSCLKGDPLSRELNQLFLTHQALRSAQDTFCQSVGLQTLKSALELYSLKRISFQTLLRGSMPSDDLATAQISRHLN